MSILPKLTLRSLLGSTLAAIVFALAVSPAEAQSCDQQYARYEGSSWWWGAFGNCKRPGGPTDRNAAFECAWAQVPAGDKSDCLKSRLLVSTSTRNGIDAVLAANAPQGPSCDQLFAKYEGSSWWWGAFGNCKRPGGPTDRNAIFECAWAQVPANEKSACLKSRLQGSNQTRSATDVVVAANTPVNACDQLFAKYEGSSWWWGAFGNCKRPGGPTDRNAVFECAWAQVPPNEKDPCLRSKLVGSASTKNGIDAVLAVNGIVSGNRGAETPAAEACRETGPAHVPHGYFLTPNEMTDAPSPAYNDPARKGLNIGTNEGRIRADLRAAAKRADPLNSLALATYYAAAAKVDTDKKTQDTQAALGNAYADLSVTGRASYAKFEKSQPTAAQIVRALHDQSACSANACNQATQLCVPGCPAAARYPDAALTTASNTALDRAYLVANILRLSNVVKGADGNADSSPDRQKLGWIAVSGEDDQPYRPVNVPTTKYPQYDVTITVGSRQVPTRYMIAQTQGPLASTTPTKDRRLPTPATPTLAANAEVILFIHGMDSRVEEAEDLADALRAVAPTRNFAVISVDLPTSGYAENLDHCSIPRANPDPKQCASLFELGDPKEPPQWFDAHGRHNAPVLDFIESFIVSFVDTLDRTIPIKARFKSVAGGSLGGNMSLRLGRRTDLPWLRNVVAWSPASIWTSLADGTVISLEDAALVGTKHGGVRAGWQSAGGNAINLTEDPGARRQFFADAFDKSVLGGVVSPAQAQMWFSDRWPCKQSALVGARLDRHETYNRNFRLWHWRLGTEQLIFSHNANDATGRPLYLSNLKRTFLLCGADDDFSYTNICSSTQIVAARMTSTPGQALFLGGTGHSIDTEHPAYFARKVSAFLAP